MFRQTTLCSLVLCTLSPFSSALFIGGYGALALNGLQGPKDTATEIHAHHDSILGALSIGHESMLDRQYGLGFEGYYVHSFNGKKNHISNSTTTEKSSISRRVAFDLKPLWKASANLELFGLIGYSNDTVKFDHTQSSSTTEYKKSLHGLRFGAGSKYFFSRNFGLVTQFVLTKLQSDKVVASSVNSYELGGKVFGVGIGVNYHI